MPNINWNDVNESKDGNFERVTPGGYVCVITGMEHKPEAQYVRLEYDIAEGEHMGFYSDDYYANKPWSHSTALSYKDTALSMLKSRLMRITESNAGFDALAAFDNDKWMDFIGKKVGIILGEEEYEDENDGKVKTSIKPRSFKSVQDIRDGKFKMPRKKLVDGTFAEDNKDEQPKEEPADTATDANPSAYDDTDVPF